MFCYNEKKRDTIRNMKNVEGLHKMNVMWYVCNWHPLMQYQMNTNEKKKWNYRIILNIKFSQDDDDDVCCPYDPRSRLLSCYYYYTETTISLW